MAHNIGADSDDSSPVSFVRSTCRRMCYGASAALVRTGGPGLGSSRDTRGSRSQVTDSIMMSDRLFKQAPLQILFIVMYSGDLRSPRAHHTTLIAAVMLGPDVRKTASLLYDSGGQIIAPPDSRERRSLTFTTPSASRSSGHPVASPAPIPAQVTSIGQTHAYSPVEIVGGLLLALQHD